MTTSALKAQLPGVTAIIILIVWALCLWCDAILLPCGCVHLQSPNLGYLEGKMLQSVGNWLSVSPQWGACRGRWLYAGWTGRSPRERLPGGLAWVKICIKQENPGCILLLNIFLLHLNPSASDYCDVVLPFVIALQAALAGCSGEAKCHINWAFLASLLLCLHPQSSQLVVILQHIYPIPHRRYSRVNGMS